MSMNTNFSLKRVGLLLRADAIENRRGILFFNLLLLTLFFMWFYFNREDIARYSTSYDSFYSFALLGLNVFYCQRVAKKVHHSQGLYMTLPAGNAEKFVALLLKGLFLLICFGVMLLAGAAVSSLVTGLFPGGLDFMTRWNHWLVSVILLISSLMFLFYMLFKRFALPIFLASGMAFNGFFFWMIHLLVTYVGEPPAWLERLGEFVANNEILQSLVSHFYLVILLMALGVLYGSYVVFKRRQLR